MITLKKINFNAKTIKRAIGYSIIATVFIIIIGTLGYHIVTQPIHFVLTLLIAAIFFGLIALGVWLLN
jgi:hypothetical protein